MTGDPYNVAVDFFATAPAPPRAPAPAGASLPAPPQPPGPPRLPDPHGPPPQQGRRQHGPVAIAIFVALALVLGGLQFAVFSHAHASHATGDGVLAEASGPAPEPRHYAHPQRLLPQVAPPSGPGSYSLISGSPSTMLRYDPCQPIHYVVSGGEPFGGATATLQWAFAQASKATGLEFVYDGVTTEQPSLTRPTYQPARYGTQWAPVLVAWTNAATVPRLGGRVVGVGGSQAATIGGHRRLVTGLLYLDSTDMASLLLLPVGQASVRNVLLHEIGHIVGLGHVDDVGAVMNPESTALDHYSAGDLRGLALMGAGPCFHSS